MRVSTQMPVVFLICLMLISGCRPELPVTSSIVIETEGFAYPVNKELYGLTIEEINHAIDGGIYAELIRNGSFEEGVVPPYCLYDAGNEVLITPNGRTIPFIRPDSIPGWSAIAPNTYIVADNKKAINDKNQRSLMVYVYAPASGRGGVVAEGYNGIAIHKGERYNLSFYTRTATSVTPQVIQVALEDSSVSKVLSNVFQYTPSFDWRKIQCSFIANEDAENALLTFSSDSTTFFWLDVVSLMPEKTWNNRSNGQRLDLMERIAELKPSFIRFPGGSFAEGYAAGTYPEWKESIGDIAGRKHFWNIWGYESTNGMGFHEFLQMCEDLKAEPLYVVNSGITNQKQSPHHEDISQMDKRIGDVLDAIAYANRPADSVWGAIRAANGHREPFNLKYVEIGSENYGQDYNRKFELFKEAINTAYPDILVISSSRLRNQSRNDWADEHFYSKETFFITNHNRFERNYQRQSPDIFIGELSTIDRNTQGTLRAAVAEACLLIAAEASPESVKKLAYASVLGNDSYELQRYPLLLFNHTYVVASPSYYLLQMFNKYRGDNLLGTTVNTFLKPQVAAGQACIEVSGNGYEIRNIRVNNEWVEDSLMLASAHLNSIPAGDSTLYNYDFTARFRRIKGNETIRLLVRDNGLREEEAEYICMTLGSLESELYYQAGSVRDTLASPKPFNIENDRWYNLKISCINDTVRCLVDGVVLHEAILSPLPSLVSLATLDREKNAVILKVVNTARHEEKTEIHISGARIKRNVQLIQLSGIANVRNTFEYPNKIVPVEETISFPRNKNLIYNFPANSVTVLVLPIE